MKLCEFLKKLKGVLMLDTKPKITKVIQKKGNKLVVNEINENTDKLEKVFFLSPDWNDKITICFDNKKEVNTIYRDLRAAFGEPNEKLEEVLESINYDEDFLKDIKNLADNEEFEISEFKGMKDITDNLFNNFSDIEYSTLISEGLWIGNGIRYIKLTQIAS